MGLNHLTLKTRQILAFAAILLITALVAGLGVWQLRVQNQISQDVATREVQRNLLAQTWAQMIKLNWVRTAAAMKSADATYAAALQAEMALTSQEINLKQKALEALLSDSAGHQLMADVAIQRSNYVGARAAILKNRDAGQSLTDAVDRQLTPLAQRYLAAVDRVAQYAAQELDRVQTQANSAAQRSVEVLLAVAAGAIVLGLVLAWVVSRSIIRPVRQAVETVQSVSRGDLSRPIGAEGSDEIAQLLTALGHMQQQLRHTFEGLYDNSFNVDTASAEIAQGNSDMADRTEHQASALTEITSAIQQIEGTVMQNVNHVQRANQLAVDTEQVAAKGGQVVTEFVSTMKGINESSRRIGDIIGVIDSIAFQTNILALNAAVEAARAGAQGRGFAVVAAEVRTLAQRSATAAQEIKQLITDSMERVSQGSRLVNDAGGTMSEVLLAVRKMSDLMRELDSSAATQTIGVSQVLQAVRGLERDTQLNATLAEESARAAESLKQQSTDMVRSMSAFRLEGGSRLERSQAG